MLPSTRRAQSTAKKGGTKGEEEILTATAILPKWRATSKTYILRSFPVEGNKFYNS